MKRAVIILPYYGVLPWYFNYYLKSLEGRRFDVLFVSDLEVKDAPKNLKQIKMSFDELNALIVAKVPGAVPLVDTRKLCDYKPMYGLIFEDYIRNYDYWGFGDCDLIYGSSIDALLSQLFDEGRDIISFCRYWISGSFCLLKNTASLREVYRNARDLQDVFTISHCVCFDELGGFWFRDLTEGRMTMDDCRREKEYFTALVWRLPDINFYHEDIMCEDCLAHGAITVRGGHIYQNAIERCAFHYINVKRNPAFKDNGRMEVDAIGDYIVTKAGMFAGRRRFFWRLVWLYRKLKFHVLLRVRHHE